MNDINTLDRIDLRLLSLLQRDASLSNLEVADRVHVEQPLRGVRVAAVAGVDDVHVRGHVLRDQVGRKSVV